MITLYHCVGARSFRPLWLLEELGLAYEIKRYERDAETMLAPPELKAIHPLGKSPVITDGDKVIAETGAIVEYILETYGQGRLIPTTSLDQYAATLCSWFGADSGALGTIVPNLGRFSSSNLGFV